MKISEKLMKTMFMIFAAIFIGWIIFGRYGYVIYGSFGPDVHGYTADQKGKEAAYKLHGAYNQVEIDNCFRNLGIDPDPRNLERVESDILSGKMTVTPALKICIEKKAEGYASPKKDVKNAAKAIKTALTPTPDPVWVPVGEIRYTPNKPYWQTFKETVSAGKGKCRIRCTYGYEQYFADIKRWQYVNPNGWPTAKNTALEDPQYTPLAQLIRVNGVTRSVQSQEFECDSVIEASFISNQGRRPIDVEYNRGQAVFVIEKISPSKG